jgi:hypothetical protein
MEIRIISLILIVFMTITIVLGIIKIHTYPEKIAKQKKHPQTKAISVTALLGLLIFPLWMFALVWAYSNAVLGNLYNQGDVEKDASDLKGENQKSEDRSRKSGKKEPTSDH